MLKPESQSNSPEEGGHPSPHSAESSGTKGTTSLTILPSTTQARETANGDPMDTTASTSAAMGPPALSSPEVEQTGGLIGGSAGALDPMNPSQAGPGAALGAAAQPKVVQTAFIHKLYKYVARVLGWR